MSKETPFDIALPAQDRSPFSHFELRPESARAWATQLPVTNIRAVSGMLLHALGDLNRTPLRPELRHEILETLSDYLRVTLSNLTRRFLNQPLVMPSEPERLAERAQGLLAELQTAYSIVALETQRDHESIRGVNPARLLCESLQQALRYAGQRVLLAFQLHRPAPIGSWLSLHRLYALGEWQGLESLPLEGDSRRRGSIASTYLQALMLGCSKPNQLLPADLEAVYHALGQWHDKLEIGQTERLEGLFAVDLASDQPAVYRTLYGEYSPASIRAIDCSALVEHLKILRDPANGYTGAGIRLDCGLTLADAMIAHLIEALGSMSMRTFKRASADHPVLVSFGLSGAHYHAAGEHSFSRLLHGSDYRPDLLDSANPFLNEGPAGDVWESGDRAAGDKVRNRDARPGAEATHNIELDLYTRSLIDEIEVAPAERDVPIHRVRQRNASPGGYCLEWDRDLPDGVRSGDILCIQENPHASWSIASIRWVSRLENAHTLVGVELISPQATACGVQPWEKVGASRNPQRGLLLPEIRLIGQPPTVITPRTGFREGMKVTLLRYGEARHARLQRQRAATASFAQFEFRDIRRTDEMLAGDKRGPLGSAYDSVWSNI